MLSELRVIKLKSRTTMESLCWYHISDIKKNDMITKLVCQLPDVDGFGRKGRLSFDPEHVSKTLAGHQMTGNTGLIQIMLRIFQIQHRMLLRMISPMQLRSASVNEVQIREYTTRPFQCS